MLDYDFGQNRNTDKPICIVWANLHFITPCQVSNRLNDGVILRQTRASSNARMRQITNGFATPALA